MDGGSNTLGLITGGIALIALFVTVLKLEGYPKIRFLLLVLVLCAGAAFCWLIAPAMLHGTKSNDQAGIESIADEMKRQDALKEIADMKQRIADDEKEAADARETKKELAAAEKDMHESIEGLHSAEKSKALLDAKAHVIGRWRWMYVTPWTFNPDGTISVSYGVDAVYKILDGTHVQVTTFHGHGGTMIFELDQTGLVMRYHGLPLITRSQN